MDDGFTPGLMIGLIVGFIATLVAVVVSDAEKVDACEKENAPYQCERVVIPMTEASND